MPEAQDLTEAWPRIRKIATRAFPSSLHFAFATLGSDGAPHVAPIGSLVLHRHEPRGFYFEIFTTGTPRNLDRDPRIAILAVDSRRTLWLTALITGRFPTPPAVRLLGRAGERRPALPRELEIWNRRVRLLRWTRGYGLLWKNPRHVREITFEGYQPVNLGKMSPWP